MFPADVRTFLARVVTLDFLVDGTLHLPPRRSTVQVLNADDRPFLPLTGCTLRDRADGRALREVDYVVIPKERLLWLAGGEADTPATSFERVERAMLVLYPHAELAGILPSAPGLRLQDALSGPLAARRFHELRRVVERPLGGGPESRHEFLCVNLRLAGALHDVTTSRAPRARRSGYAQGG